MSLQVCLAGDCHGDVSHIRYLIRLCLEFDVTKLIVLGDFSYWEHQDSGIYYLDSIEEEISGKNLEVYFITGNHENYTLLYRRYLDRHDIGRDTETVETQLRILEEKKGPWTPQQNDEGFWKVREGLWYIPRTAMWTWNDVKFAALGGAFSIDINLRRAGTSWWPEEMIEPEEVDFFHDKGPVDIFLSHDVPEEINIQTKFAIRGLNFFKADQRSAANRSLLSKAVEHAHPNYLYHGHMHINYKSHYKLYDGHMVEVMGLGMNGMGPESWTIIDLDKKELIDVG